MAATALRDWLEATIGEPCVAGSPAEVVLDDEADAVSVRLRELDAELAGLGGLRSRVVEAGMDLPLSLGNTAMQNLNDCEGLAVARAGEEQVTTWEMFRGRALDSYVAHAVSCGPVGDPVDDLRSMWSATERFDDLALLERFGADPSNVADLGGLAASVATFTNCTRWIPRSEVIMSCPFGAAFSLRGRVDVVFGGPGTGLPAVLVEVKSARLRDSHFAQLRHYVMLAALRHREMPAGAALWSPEAGLVPLHVSGSALSAAERMAVAAGRLVELWLGRDRVLTPGLHCRFCAAEQSCPKAHDYDDPWDEHR